MADYDNITIRVTMDASGVVTGAQQVTAVTGDVEKNLQGVAEAAAQATAATRELDAALESYSSIASAAEKHAAAEAEESRKLAAAKRDEARAHREAAAAMAVRPSGVPYSTLEATGRRINEASSLAARAMSGVGVASQAAFATPAALTALDRNIKKLSTTATESAAGITAALSNVKVPSGTLSAITKDLREVQNVASAAASGVTTAFTAAAVPQKTLQAVTEDLSTSLAMAGASAGRIGVALGEGAVVSSAALANIGRDLATTQATTERAAHGISTAMEAAFVAPATLRSIGVQVQEQATVAERAAHGITTAMEVAFATPASLKSLGTGIVDRLRKAGDEGGKELASKIVVAAETAGVALGGSIGRGAREASGAINNLGADIRHVVAGVDELSRGAKGAFASTVIAATRDSGLLAAALSKVTVAGVATAATFGIIGAGIAEALYAGFEWNKGITDTARSLALLGQSSEFSSDQISGWARTLVKDFGEGASSVRKIMDEFNTLGGSASHLRPQLAQLGEALAYFRNISSDAGAKEIAKVYEGGAASALKFADHIRALTPAQAEHVKALIAAGQEERALDEITAALNARFGEAGAEVAKADEAIYRFFGTTKDAIDPITLLIRGVVSLRDAMSGLRVDTSKIAPELSAVRRAGQEVSTTAAPEEAHRLTLQERLNTLKAAELDLQKQINSGGFQNLPGGGASVSLPGAVDANQLALQKELERNRTAQANLAVEETRIVGAEEMRQHQENLAAIERERALHHYSAESQVADLQRVAEETRRFEEEKLRKAGVAPEEATTRAAQEPDVVKANTAVLAEQQRFERQKVEIAIESERARVDEAERGSRDRLQAELDILQLLQDAQRRGLASELDIAAQRVRIATAERQVRHQAYLDFAAEERQKVAEAKGDADAIIAIYQDWADKAATVYGQRPSVITSIQTEGVKAEAQALAERFRAAEGDVRSYEAISRQRIAIDKAEQDILVAQHRESKSAALAEEQKYTEDVLAQVVERVKSEELATASSDDDRIKALQDLGKAEEDYATKVIEDQARITQAIEAENKKQVETIKQGFDAVGSAFEGVTKGIIDGQLTATTRIVQQYHVAENGVVFFTNTVQNRSLLANAGLKILDATGTALTDTFLKLGEQAAAKNLAPLFGQQFTEGETPSLSGLFAKVVGGFFGLGTKKPPEDGLAKAGDKLAEAAASLKQAGDLLAQKGVAGIGAGAHAPGTLSPMTSPSQTAAEYAVGGAPIPGSADTQSQIYQWLIANGYSPTAASAVIGNAAAESGLRTDIIGKAGELGLFQELGPRRKGLEDYAASTGRSPTDLNTQLEYMDQELMKLDPAFKKAGDSADVLAKKFETEFERPKSLADAPRRAGYAEQVYSAQSGTALSKVDIEQVSGSDLPVVSGDGLPVTGTSPVASTGAAGLPGALADNTAALRALTDKLSSQTQIGSVTAAQSASGGLAASAPTTPYTPLSRGASSTGSATSEATSGILSAGGAIGSLVGGPVGQVTSGVTKLVGAFNTVTTGVSRASDGIERLATGTTSLTTVTQAAQTIKTAETAATQISTTATIADQAATQTMASDALTAGAEFQAAGAQAAAGGGIGGAAGAAGAVSGGTKGIFGLGGFLGIFAEGTDQVPSDGLAFVHQDEMIVPAGQAQVLRSLGFTASGSVGTASTPSYIYPATPPPPTQYNTISNNPSSGLAGLGGIAAAGAGLLSAAPLISKLFGGGSSALPSVDALLAAPATTAETAVSSTVTPLSTDVAASIASPGAAGSTGGLFGSGGAAASLGGVLPALAGLGIGAALGGLIGGKTGAEIGGGLGLLAGLAVLFLEEGEWQVSRDGMLASLHQDEMVVPARAAAALRSRARGFGDLPHFELGAWELSRDQAGFLHKGESVVPASAADNLRALLSGGGTTNNSGDVNLHYSPTVNAPAAPDLEMLLHRQGQTMLGWINAQMRSGALRPPPV